MMLCTVAPLVVFFFFLICSSSALIPSVCFRYFVCVFDNVTLYRFPSPKHNGLFVILSAGVYLTGARAGELKGPKR